LTKREVVKMALDGQKPPYTPWSFRFTVEAQEKLIRHYKTKDLINSVDNHIVELGSDIGFFEDMGNDRWKDVFGVVWNRTVDKDIGDVEHVVLPTPALDGYEFPNPLDSRFFVDIPGLLEHYEDRYRLFKKH